MSASTTQPEPMDARLAARAAEMLALPHLICTIRRCRRGNICRYRFIQSGLPCCVDNLDEPHRAVFHALYADAVYVSKHWSVHSLIPAEAERRELRDAAFEVVRRTLLRKEWRAFARRLRERETRADPAGSQVARESEAFERFLMSWKGR